MLLCSTLLADIPFTFTLRFEIKAASAEAEDMLFYTIWWPHIQCTSATSHGDDIGYYTAQPTAITPNKPFVGLERDAKKSR